MEFTADWDPGCCDFRISFTALLFPTVSWETGRQERAPSPLSLMSEKLLHCQNVQHPKHCKAVRCCCTARSAGSLTFVPLH